MIPKRPLPAILLMLFVTVVLFALIAPLVVPLPEPTDLVEPRALADADSRFASVNGLEVHYKSSGEGEPAAILLHAGAHSTASFSSVLPALAADRRVVAFDRVGYGLTQRPAPDSWQGESPYSAQFQSDLVVALMDALGIRRAFLVGSAAGGAVAMLCALQHPEHIAGLVVTSPGLESGLDEGAGGPRKFLMRSPHLRRIGPSIVRRQLMRHGDDVFKQFWHQSDRMPAELLEALRKPMRVAGWAEALYEVGLAARPLGVTARLAELKMPALVLTGEHDKFVPLDENERLVKAMPNARLAVVKDCGHLPHEECPDQFLDVVKPFLASAAPR